MSDADKLPPEIKPAGPAAVTGSAWTCSVRMEPRIDNVLTGEHARKERKRCGTSLREVARRLRVSAAYISDLELGRRNWDDKRLCEYMLAVHRSPEPPTPAKFLRSKTKATLYESPNIIEPDINIIREMNPSQKSLQDQPEYWPEWARKDLQRLAEYRCRCVVVAMQAQRESQSDKVSDCPPNS